MPSANQTRAEQFGPPNKKAPSTSVSRVPQILGFLHRPASMLFGKQPSAKSSHHRTSAPGQQDKQRSQPGSKTAGKKVSFPEPNQLLPTGNATKEATRVDSRSLRIPPDDSWPEKTARLSQYEKYGSTSIDPKRFSKKITKNPVRADLKRDCAAPDRHEEVAVRMIVRTALWFGLVAFVVTLLGTLILNVLFSTINYTTTSTDHHFLAPPSIKPNNTVNNYIFLTIIFAVVSCILSVIGSLFLNLMMRWVTSRVDRSSLGNTVVPYRRSQII